MKKGILRRIATVALALLFVASSGIFLKQFIDKQQAQRTYEAALAAAMSESESVPAAQAPQAPSLPTMPVFSLPEDGAFLAAVDLPSLRATNEDVLGWIHIPGSVISYPLMRSHDNEEYLHHTWDGTPNVAGSIFLEQHSSPDFTDFNTIIYGHAMNDGSMFAELHKYQWQDVPEQYPYVYVAIDGAVLRYAIFACYEANISSDTYRLTFADDAARERALEQYHSQSSITMPLTVNAESHILTLSTCTGNQKAVRLVVQAVLDGILPR